MKIITIAAQKGGVGKTITAFALSQAVRKRNKTVCCIDLDPQGNLTAALGGDFNASVGSCGLFTGKRAKGLVQRIDGVSLIPSSWDLSTVLKSEELTLDVLRDAIRPLREYDYVIIDTPPTASVLQYAAIAAADAMIIPVTADAFSMQTLTQIADTEKRIGGRHFKGAIITRYDGRSTLSKQFHDAISERAERLGIPLIGTIRNGIAVVESAALKEDLYKYAPKSKPAQDYLTLFDIIDKQINNRNYHQ